MPSLSEMNELVNEMVAAVDDGDGEIDYDEFVKMIQKY
jgi:Ca2+-binding EF-hand superfamily protein